MIRRGLAFVLIGLVVILGQLAVSHIHGLSDPDSAHTIGDYVLLAQARTGFAAAAILLVIVLLAALWGPRFFPAVRPIHQFASFYSVRAPPPLI